MQNLKKSISDALERNDLEKIAAFALQDRKIVSLLVRSAYAKDARAGRRAGRLAARLLHKGGWCGQEGLTSISTAKSV